MFLTLGGVAVSLCRVSGCLVSSFLPQLQQQLVSGLSLSPLNIVSLGSYLSSVRVARSTRLNPPATTISLYLKDGRNSETRQIQISEAAGCLGECPQPSRDAGQAAGQWRYLGQGAQ